MDITHSKQLARDIFERGFGRGELDVVDAGVAPDAIDRHPFAPDEPDMRHHLKNAIGMLRDVIPDLKVNVADLFGEGDRIAVRVEITAPTPVDPYSASRRPVSRSNLSSSTSFSSTRTASASATGPTSASSSSY